MQKTNTPTSTYVSTTSVVSKTYHPTSITLLNKMDVEVNSIYNFNFLFYKCSNVT